METATRSISLFFTQFRMEGSAKSPSLIARTFLGLLQAHPIGGSSATSPSRRLTPKASLTPCVAQDEHRPRQRLPGLTRSVCVQSEDRVGELLARPSGSPIALRRTPAIGMQIEIRLPA